MESMSLKKRNFWLLEYIRKLNSQIEDPSKQLSVFTKAPYAGMFLYYLLFEEYCQDHKTLELCLSNLREQDYKKLIYIMPESWTDIPPSRDFHNSAEQDHS